MSSPRCWIFNHNAQCYGQLVNWKIGDQNYYRQFAEKKSEFTKSSLAIWGAANWATKISSATLLLISHRHASTALKMVNRFTNSKEKKY